MSRTSLVMKNEHVPVTQVVRVAVSNNFNCTEAEFAQLDEFMKKNPHRYFFVNSNIATPKLLALNDHPYKAVITVNPLLVATQTNIYRLYAIDPNKVAFVRVKYLPEDTTIQRLILELHEKNYTIVVTPQRFIRKDTLLQYTSLEHYKHSCSRFRLTDVAMEELREIVVGLQPDTYICDLRGLGCQGCGLCAALTLTHPAKILSLNLSTSGVCKNSCPDCYARAIYGRCKARGNLPIYYDKIYRNDKQTGRTKHIQENKGIL